VKFYCCRCRLVFNYDEEFGKVDGCFVGKTFPHLFFMEFPELMPIRENLKKIVPNVYGFTLTHDQPSDNDYDSNELKGFRIRNRRRSV